MTDQLATTAAPASPAPIPTPDPVAALKQATAPGTFRINKVVAFLGPYIAIVSGALATWLITHFPGLHLDRSGTASTIAKALTFLIGAAATWALHHKWLDGWQKWEAQLAGAAAASSATSAAAAQAARTAPPAFDALALATALPVPPPPVSAVNGASAETAGLGVPTDGV